MMENDNDRLLNLFFAEHRQEIADNGFSRRVMRRLPQHSNRLSQIWTAFSFTLALVLLIAFGGLQTILNTLRETFEAVVLNGAAELDPKSMLIAGIVLIYLVYRKIATLA